ncbi:MFS transporter [Limimaricola sp.]|uniref:MFS transporter n=1 Tax=Limimaricola sp. TaxID=2211665 RepID=UPI0025C256E6|nr:MFS transporter [Limimaricola sp.]
MTTPAKTPLRQLARNRDFRLLLTASILSRLGDQFALIATPWLVLQVSHDPMLLGLVLALEGLPRAGVMLLGGAVTDRISPRRMMYLADALRFALVGLMAAAVLGGQAGIPLILGFSLAFGTVAGFAVPAETAILPLLVPETALGAGNGVQMALTEVAAFVGPSLAGLLVGGAAAGADGTGWAYALDAASFAASGLCLLFIRGGAAPAPAQGDDGLLAEIRDALAHVWHDGPMRMMFLLLAAVNFLLVGPLLVGIPLIAAGRLPQGATAFGLLMSAFSLGNLVGLAAAGVLPRPRAGAVRAILIALLFGFAAVLPALAVSRSIASDAAMLAAVGLGNGYLAILLYTWLQGHTPRRMLGRVMSMLMLANIGLVPISQAVSGAVAAQSLTALLGGSGLAVAALAAWTMLHPCLAPICRALAAPTLAAQ